MLQRRLLIVLCERHETTWRQLGCPRPGDLSNNSRLRDSFGETVARLERGSEFHYWLMERGYLRLGDEELTRAGNSSHFWFRISVVALLLAVPWALFWGWFLG